MASILTPEGRVSYPALFEAKAGPDPNGRPKYGCVLIFPKSADLTALTKAAGEALELRWGKKAKDMLRRGELRWPIRDGAAKDAAGYGVNTVFINMASTQQPGVVDGYAGPDGRPRVITDPKTIYPGCFARAAVGVYTYDRQGNRGVAFGLNALQFLRDGERLDGRRAAQDEFDALEGEPPAADLNNLDDLLG
jgi:hypothetical protein